LSHQYRQRGLILITTALAPQDSIASLLKDSSETRDTRTALTKLMDVATISTSETLKSSFDAFSSLKTPQKRLLVESIIVVDNEQTIKEFENIIKKKLYLSVRREHLESLYERLEGWWFNKVIMHFTERNNIPIKKYELQSKIRDIAEQFEEDALPIDFLDAEPPETPDASNDDRLFVVQLRIIALNNKLIEKAIRDYYKAFEQRSRWTRENLLVDKELEKYEEKLVDEWERIFLAATDNVGDTSIADIEHEKTGRKIFTWINTTAQIPLRPKVTEPYVMRGSYHMLANQTPPKVGWHPKFVARLQEILTPAKEQ
jgi:hypothetical protein